MIVPLGLLNILRQRGRRTIPINNMRFGINQKVIELEKKRRGPGPGEKGYKESHKNLIERYEEIRDENGEEAARKQARNEGINYPLENAEDLKRAKQKTLEFVKNELQKEATNRSKEKTLQFIRDQLKKEGNQGFKAGIKQLLQSQTPTTLNDVINKLKSR